MKKVFLIGLLSLLIGPSIYAQSGSGFGLKAGLNYNANGDYVESFNSNIKHPDRNIGYHVGVFGKLGNSIYVKPELVFTSTKSDYDSETYSMQKLDLPVLVGVKIIGPVSVFAGPAFQYIVDSDFEGITIDSIDNDFSIGLNFGVGLNINKLGVDLRYERGFNTNEATFLSNNSVNINRLDTRPDQLILSLSLLL